MSVHKNKKTKNYRQEIIKATRELTFSDCEILVEAAVGEVCGYVRKT